MQKLFSKTEKYVLILRSDAIANDMQVIRDPSWPQGLVLYEGIFSPENAKKVFDRLEEMEWSDALSRKVQQYGYFYPYDIKEPQTRILKKTTPAPKFLQSLAECLFSTGLLTDYPNQIIVNRYLPGEGIGKHRDHYPIFGRDVVVVSLGSDIDMSFEPYGKDSSGEPTILRLKIGSIMVFGGDARMKWSHEIKKRKTDIVEGKKIARGVRISITFRHVNEEFAEI